MTPPSDNRERQEVDETAEKARHVFESTKTYLESTVAEARVIENKTRYLLVLTLSVSFGLVSFLTVAAGNSSYPAFLFDLAWVGGILLLVLALVSFVLTWNLLPKHTVHYPGSTFRSLIESESHLRPLWEAVLVESHAYQQRIDANTELNRLRGAVLMWSTRAVLTSLAMALGGFLYLWVPLMQG